MFRTLGHNYIIQKYLFRISPLMPSSRWYKKLNFNFLDIKHGFPTSGSRNRNHVSHPSNRSPTWGKGQARRNQFISVIIKQLRLPPSSPLPQCYSMFRTLGHNYVIQKYLFRLSSLMSSSRSYKALNFNSIYTTEMRNLVVA